MSKYVRVSKNDYNSVSLFDKDRKNKYGEIYCIAGDILPHEVDEYWDMYLGGFR